jgi:hypothetical protein
LVPIAGLDIRILIMTIKILNSIYNAQTGIDTVEFDTGDSVKRTVIGNNIDKSGNFDELIISAINNTTEFTNTDYYLDNNTLYPLPNKPSTWNTWDWETNTWTDTRPLIAVKEAKWLQIKDARNSAEYGGFLWNGYVFDSDPVSQQRISGAVQLSQIVPNYSVDWTLKNNTTVTLNAQDMLAVGVALGEHVSATHQTARILREQIEQASTNAQVDAITWS